MKFKTTTAAAISAGFTLIELLVVISIIGLLTSVVLVATVRARQSAQDQVALQDITTMSKALDLYYQDNGTYPNFGSSPISSTDAVWTTGMGPALQPYLQSLPTGKLTVTYFSVASGSNGSLSIRINGPPFQQKICLHQNSYVMFTRLYDARDNRGSIWIEDLFGLAGGDYQVNYVGSC